MVLRNTCRTEGNPGVACWKRLLLARNHPRLLPSRLRFLVRTEFHRRTRGIPSHPGGLPHGAASGAPFQEPSHGLVFLFPIAIRPVSGTIWEVHTFELQAHLRTAYPVSTLPTQLRLLHRRVDGSSTPA